MTQARSVTRNFWGFLAAGFLAASLLGGIAIWTTTGSTLARLQNDSVRLTAAEITNELSHQIDDHINGFAYLARRPRIVGAVMGDDTDLGNARDVISSFDLFPDVLRVEVIDVLGVRIAEHTLDQDRAAKFDIETGQLQADVQRILEADHAAEIQISSETTEGGILIYALLPIRRARGVEGILLGVFTVDLMQFYRRNEQLLHLEIVRDVDIEERIDEDTLHLNAPLTDHGLVARYQWSLESVRHQRQIMVQAVAGSLIAGLFVAFCALAWVGRQMIVAPHRALEESRRALAESEAKARELAYISEHSFDSIAINDRDGRMIWNNSTHSKTWGWEQSELVGKRPIDVLAGAETDATEMWKCYKEGRPYRGELILYHRDGTPVHVNHSLQPLYDEDGVARRFIAIGRDITDLKRRAAELEEAKAKAESAAQAKSNFLANMSHEIRTPMNGIIGMCELLNETELNDEQSLCARTINDSAAALLTIINDILDFSKIEAGRQELVTSEFDLGSLVHDVARLLFPKAQEKNIELVIDYAAEAPRSLVGDDGRVRQILLNLAGNAIKFTTEGHVCIRVPPLLHAAQGVRIEVADTGIGIPEAKLSNVFQAFEQVDNEVTREFDGTGLGLAITRGLVDLLGGTINVTSIEGEGSCFSVDLQLPPAGPPEHLFHGSADRNLDSIRERGGTPRSS